MVKHVFLLNPSDPLKKFKNVQIYIGEVLCHEISEVTTPGIWYKVDCNTPTGLTGTEITIKSLETPDALSFCGVKVYGYQITKTEQKYHGENVAIDVDADGRAYLLTKQGRIL